MAHCIPKINLQTKEQVFCKKNTKYKNSCVETFQIYDFCSLFLVCFRTLLRGAGESVKKVGFGVSIVSSIHVTDEVEGKSSLDRLSGLMLPFLEQDH